MTRIVLTLAAAGLLSAAFAQDKETKSPPDLKADLAAMQGKWEQASTSGAVPPGFKRVKEVKGDQETVTVFDAEGKVLRAARATIKLSESGGVRVLTFSDGEVTDGLGKGRKQSESASYIYRMDGDEWHEVGGLLTNEKYSQDVPYLTKWKRADKPARKPGVVEGAAKLMQGEWVFTAQTDDGVEVPANLLKPLRLTIDGDTFAVRAEGRVLQEGTGTFDDTKTPKEFDGTVTGGGGKGQKWLGIYKIDGDTVTICVDPSGKKRPTEFKAEKGSGYFLNVHTRVKK
jgi:uncharacterized protein (TIGR03067 family)